MLDRTIAIAFMGFRRLIKTRILAVALVLAALVPGFYSAILVAMIIAARAGRTHEVANVMPVFVQATLMVFGIVSSVLAIIVGVTILRRDITEGTIYGVLSKPVSRGEYVVGTALSGFIMLVLVWALFGLVLTLVATVVGSRFGAIHFQIMAGRLLLTLIPLCVALLLSTRFGAWAAAALTVLVIDGVGIVEGLSSVLGALGVDVPNRLVDVLAMPFPVMNSLDGLTSRLTRSSLNAPSIAPGVIHLVDYALVMLVLTYLSFRRLELNRPSD